MNLPALIPVPRVRDVLGLSRSMAYKLAATGDLHMVKVGNSSFITAESATRYLATLPAASIRPATKAAA
jgi:hypothetical protein